MWITVNVISDFFKGAFIPLVIREQGSEKMEFVLKKTIGFDGIKSGIPQKSIGMGGLKIIIQKGGMAGNTEAVGEDREFISVPEMAVNILLFRTGTGSGL